MPIPVTCDCGRSLKVKDEMAGKRGRCPSCQAVLEIPDAEPADFVTAEVPEARRKPKPAPARYRDEDEEEPRPAKRRAARDEDEDERPARRPARDNYAVSRDDDDDRLRRRIEKPEPRPRRRVRRESSGSGFGVNGGTMITGVVMMVGACVWFFGALALGVIFIYPPLLFVLGIIAFFKGLSGRDYHD